MSKQMKEMYDVVIIGGGIGGLTAANLLVDRGLSVALFEQHFQIGGYVTSFDRKGYTFEGGLTSFGSNGIVFPLLEELGLREKFDFEPAKRQLVTDDFNVRVDGSLDALRDALIQCYPEEEKQIKRYFREIDAVSRGLQAMMDLPLIRGELKGSFPGILLLPFKHFALIRFMMAARNETKQSLHRRYFSNPELIHLLDQQGYPVMTAVTLAGMWYSFKSDYWYPMGGMQRFSNRILERYEQAGGEAYLRTPVAKILVENGTACGVQLADGRTVRAKAVLSNIDMRTTYLQLLEGKYVEQEFLDKLKAAEPSESMFTVFLGLKGKGFKQARYKIDGSHVWFGIRDEVGKNQEFAMNIPTLEDPGLARDGETVIISCFEEYDDWAKYKDRGPAYREKKEARVAEIMKLVRQVLPDVDERLEVLDAASPLTYERYTANYKGATAGWSWNPALQPKFNLKKEGHIPGLYLAGQWLFNPGGLPSAVITGRFMALELAKNLSVKK